jgi:signal transduction histidine kinase
VASRVRLSETELRRLLEVGRALVAELDIEAVLQRILETARDLTQARYAALGILDEHKRELERFVFVGIDEEMRRRIGPLPRGHGVLGELIRDPRPLRLHDVKEHPRSYGFPAGHPPMKAFLGVPISVRGEAFGNLYLTDKAGGADFDERDEESAIVLSEWAAIAIGNARLHESERLRQSIRASEAERRRWARELHDETLQDLGALKLMLEGGLRSGRAAAVAEGAIEQLQFSIEGLQDLIAELRPATLDELGIEPAITALVARTTAISGLDIDVSVQIGAGRLEPELENTVYRLVQEALTNAAKHAGAEHVWVEIADDGETLSVCVRDDGSGFATAGRSGGFGLVGMRERVALVGGRLAIESKPDEGTRVSAELPLSERS